MFRKISAVLLSAAIMGSCAVTCFAAETDSIKDNNLNITIPVTYEDAVEWNGKTALKSGKDYVVSKNVTVSKKITVPSGTTLTIKKGAKVTISTKGKLHIKGSVVVNKGATLSVKGSLNLYKSKKLTNSGKLSFGSKSTVTISGKLTNKSTGTISGTPKKLSLGSKAALSMKGKNSCTKLTEAIDKTDIAAKVDKFYETILTDTDFYKALKIGLPEKVVNEAGKLFEESFNMGIEEYCGLVTDQVKEELKAEGIDKIRSVSVKITKLTADELKSEDGMDEYYELYGDITRIYNVAFTVTIKLADGSSQKNEAEMPMALVDGEWYFI